MLAKTTAWQLAVFKLIKILDRGQFLFYPPVHGNSIIIYLALSDKSGGGGGEGGGWGHCALGYIVICEF